MAAAVKEASSLVTYPAREEAYDLIYVVLAGLKRKSTCQRRRTYVQKLRQVSWFRDGRDNNEVCCACGSERRGDESKLHGGYGVDEKIERW